MEHYDFVSYRADRRDPDGIASDYDYNAFDSYVSTLWAESVNSHALRPDHVQLFRATGYDSLLDATSCLAADCVATSTHKAGSVHATPMSFAYSDGASALLDASPSSSLSTHLSPSSLDSGEAMSRQSSVTSASSASIIDAFDMMRVESSISHSSHIFPIDDVGNIDAISFVHPHSYQPASSLPTSRCTNGRAEQLVSNIGLGFDCMDGLSAQQYLPAADLVASYNAFDDVLAMQDTTSDAIAHANADSKASARRLKHIANAKQSIAPKHARAAGPTATPTCNATSKANIRPTTLPKAKEAIPKATYTRPQHAKLFCQLCEEFPGGFRGDHELRRHHERAHARRRKVWICTEPAIKTEPWPVKPLSTCRQCQQEKPYNVYYNAAAHLRRNHWVPRKRGRRPRGEERESRAGKAGGDWPSIDWLKKHGWLREIEISSNDPTPIDTGSAATLTDALDQQPVLFDTDSTALWWN